MSAKFNYLLSGKLLRTVFNRPESVKIHKEFCNTEPIVAREMAMSSLMSFVEVMLDFHGLRYTSHNDAVKHLEEHISRGERVFAKVGDVIIDEIDHDYDLGLNLYLVTDNSKFFITKEGHKIYTERLLIHSFCTNICNIYETLFYNLQLEYRWYIANGHDFSTYKKLILSNKTILKTPFDFEEYKLKELLESL